VYDLRSPASVLSILEIKVFDAKANTYTLLEPGAVISVDEGDTIVANIKVIHFRYGTNNIERIIKYANGQEHLIYYARRPHIGPRTFTLLTEYKIQRGVKTGCGHVVFSRNTFNDAYNLLTHLFPILTESPHIPFCFK